MLKVAIYGCNDVAHYIERVINEVYNKEATRIGADNLAVVAYISEHERIEEKTPVICIDTVIELYKKGMITTIIIPTDNYVGNRSEIHSLIFGGVDINDIYSIGRVKKLDLADIDNLFVPYVSHKYLPYLEFHIADKCNLNCRACEHYSGLVKEEHFPDFEEFEASLIALKKNISDIGMIRILGGEPLLNPEVARYVRLCKNMFPDSIVGIVTNALLIKSMPDDFWDTVRECEAEIHISFYPPLKDRMESIEELFRNKGVKYVISDMITYFTKKQVLEPVEDPVNSYYHCVQGRCNNLRDGKIASCFLPFTTRFFNEYYDYNLPEDGSLDIMSDDITTEEIKIHLLKAFLRCAYCSKPQEITWGQISSPSPMSDWIL